MAGFFIQKIGTSNPSHLIEQKDAASYLINSLPDDEKVQRKIGAVFARSGIQQRYTVMDSYAKDENFLWGRQNGEVPWTKERMEVFRKNAPALIKESLNGFQPNEISAIDSLITVSCTGLMAPGLEIMLGNQLGLDPGLKKLAVNFMGCYGAFHGFKIAKDQIGSGSSKKLLMSSVEICSIHFQRTSNDSDILANALFGDGAASCLISADPIEGEGNSLQLMECSNHLFTEGHEELKWDISNTGFEMVLTSSLPGIIKSGIKELVDSFLERQGLSLHDISKFAIHPGGKRILDELRAVLKIEESQVKESYNVLKNYGNMSSSTILFVLKEILDSSIDKEKGEKVLAMAFGPGLTVELALFQIV